MHLRTRAGGPQIASALNPPEIELVDTPFHASGAPCHDMYKQAIFPTVGRKNKAIERA
jgi:hypothetical protein